jgi:hypothetical protein
LLHTPHISTLQIFSIIVVSIEQEFEEQEGCNNHNRVNNGDCGNNFYSSNTTTSKCCNLAETNIWIKETSFIEITRADSQM